MPQQTRAQLRSIQPPWCARPCWLIPRISLPTHTRAHTHTHTHKNAPNRCSSASGCQRAGIIVIYFDVNTPWQPQTGTHALVTASKAAPCLPVPVHAKDAIHDFGPEAATPTQRDAEEFVRESSYDTLALRFAHGPRAGPPRALPLATAVADEFQKGFGEKKAERKVVGPQ